MLEISKKLGATLTRDELSKLAILLLVVFVAGLFEVFGVFSILPFMQVVSDPSVIEANAWLSWFKSTLQLSSDRQVMIWLGVAVLLVYALAAVVSIVSNWMISRTVWGIAHSVCMRLLNRYTRLPFEFFLQNNSSDLTKKIISDIHSFVTGVLQSACQLIASAFKILFILCFLFTFEPQLALLAFVVYGGAYIVLHLLRHRYIERLGRERLDTISLRIKSFTETLSGIRALRVSGATNLFVRRFEKASQRFSEIQPQFLLTSLIPKHVIEMLAFGGIVCIVLFVLINDYTLLDIIPTLSVFAVATYKLLPSLSTAFTQAANFSHNLPVVDVLYEDLSNDDELLPSVAEYQAASVMGFNNQIALENVAYRYSDDTAIVLNGINLHFKKGTCNALVGTTGCGKSTVMDVMVGLLFPQQGVVSIDGVPVDRDNVVSWQKTITYVPQEVVLFDDTIAANIALGISTDDIDMERVKYAAELAQATQFIKSDTPDGFQTLIGERGVRLSGGQRQRLGLARAFYRQPKVLFLDEATSALDNVTEEAVMRAIANQLDDVTLVMIAHRLSTVSFCDTIFYIENGQVVESGGFEHLKNCCEPFRQMVDAVR